MKSSNKKATIFTREYAPYVEVRRENFFSVIFVVALVIAIISTTMFAINVYVGIIAFIPLWFLSDVAVDITMRQKLLKRIKSWAQVRKNRSLLEEVKKNNLQNVKIMLRCGADINGVVEVFDWAMDRDGEARKFRPLDAAKDAEMEKFLRERGAVTFAENKKEEVS